MSIYGGCQAKVPTAIFPRTWIICGEDATATHVYQCDCGHQRTGQTCDEHAPVPGEVGCARCHDDGHDCPMTVTTAVLA